jgi:hypothetical protein
MIQDSILVCSPDPRIPHTAAPPEISNNRVVGAFVVTEEEEIICGSA